MNKTLSRSLLVLLLIVIASFYLLPSLFYFVFKLSEFLIVAGLIALAFWLIKRI